MYKKCNNIMWYKKFNRRFLLSFFPQWLVDPRYLKCDIQSLLRSCTSINFPCRFSLLLLCPTHTQIRCGTRFKWEIFRFGGGTFGVRRRYGQRTVYTIQLRQTRARQSQSHLSRCYSRYNIFVRALYVVEKY